MLPSALQIVTAYASKRMATDGTIHQEEMIMLHFVDGVCVSESALMAIIKYHKLGGLNNLTFISHSTETLGILKIQDHGMPG